MPVIHQLFPSKVISKREDISWPPRSPDLTPMDFFLWGYLKAKVYNIPVFQDLFVNKYIIVIRFILIIFFHI